MHSCSLKTALAPYASLTASWPSSSALWWTWMLLWKGTTCVEVIKWIARYQWAEQGQFCKVNPSGVTPILCGASTKGSSQRQILLMELLPKVHPRDKRVFFMKEIWPVRSTQPWMFHFFTPSKLQMLSAGGNIKQLNCELDYSRSASANSFPNPYSTITAGSVKAIVGTSARKSLLFRQCTPSKHKRRKQRLHTPALLIQNFHGRRWRQKAEGQCSIQLLEQHSSSSSSSSRKREQHSGSKKEQCF